MVTEIAKKALKYIKKNENKEVNSANLDAYFRKMGVEDELIPSYRRELELQGLIKMLKSKDSKGPYRIVLTPEGEEYYTTNLTLKRFIDKKQILPIALSLLIGVVVVMISHSLVKPYSQPVNPTLRISLKRGTFGGISKLSTQKMIERKSYSGAKIEICVVNEGNIETGSMIFQIIDPWALSFTQNIPNVPGLDSECTDYYIMSEECYLSKEDICSIKKYIPDNLPEGMTTINFEYSCANCVENEQTGTVSFDVCIWRQSSEICKT